MAGRKANILRSLDLWSSFLLKLEKLELLSQSEVAECRTLMEETDWDLHYIIIPESMRPKPEPNPLWVKTAETDEASETNGNDSNDDIAEAEDDDSLSLDDDFLVLDDDMTILGENVA